MGDMADFANEDQWDSLEDYWDYRDKRISPSEAYDLGIIDEFGYEIQSPGNIDFRGF